VNNQRPRSGTDRPLRVLVVAARFPPDLGGTENHTYEVSKRIAERSDIELTVLATDRSGTLPASEVMDGFTVRRCRAYPRQRDYYFAPDIYRLILRGDYDLVHCQGIHTAVPVLAMLAARRRGVPYVVTLHTGGHSSAFRRRSRATQWRILAPLLRRAAAIVAVSRFEQRAFQEACRVEASRFTVIPNGGNLPAGADRPAPVPGRIVSAGRLERYKGHQRVVEALPIVRQTIPHATLRIYGAGPYEQQLRARIGSLGVAQSAEIQYIAPDNRARVAAALCQAEVFAALSEYEAHPVAVMEALTLGIPTVGLDTAGVADLVSDGLVTGIPRDASPAAVAEALVGALAAGGRGAPAALPTWDDAAAALGRIYTGVAAAGSRIVRSHNAR
jgi:glycosyltransferase involved in cell wall biosynthesis